MTEPRQDKDDETSKPIINSISEKYKKLGDNRMRRSNSTDTLARATEIVNKLRQISADVPPLPYLEDELNHNSPSVPDELNDADQRDTHPSNTRIRLIIKGMGKTLPDIPELNEEDDQGMEAEPMFDMDEIDESEDEENEIRKSRFNFSADTMKMINDILNDDFADLSNLAKNNEEVSYESSKSSSTTYNDRSTVHRRAHLENYWCDFCANEMFMHEVSARKRIDNIVKKYRLIDEDNKLRETDFFRNRRPEAHELGVILAISGDCRSYMAYKYNPVYNQYVRVLSSSTMPSYEFISKGLIYQYNKRHYELVGIGIHNIDLVRSDQLKNGLQCSMCRMIACPFHRKYGNFDMSEDLCGWCDVPDFELSSFSSSDTIPTLDRTIYNLDESPPITLEPVSSEESDCMGCDCEECKMLRNSQKSEYDEI